MDGQGIRGIGAVFLFTMTLYCATTESAVANKLTIAIVFPYLIPGFILRPLDTNGGDRPGLRIGIQRAVFVCALILLKTIFRASGFFNSFPLPLNHIGVAVVALVVVLVDIFAHIALDQDMLDSPRITGIADPATAGYVVGIIRAHTAPNLTLVRLIARLRLPLAAAITADNVVVFLKHKLSAANACTIGVILTGIDGHRGLRDIGELAGPLLLLRAAYAFAVVKGVRFKFDHCLSTDIAGPRMAAEPSIPDVLRRMRGGDIVGPIAQSAAFLVHARHMSITDRCGALLRCLFAAGGACLRMLKRDIVVLLIGPGVLVFLGLLLGLGGLLGLNGLRISHIVLGCRAILTNTSIRIDILVFARCRIGLHLGLLSLLGLLLSLLGLLRRLLLNGIILIRRTCFIIGNAGLLIILCSSITLIRRAQSTIGAACLP